MTSSAQNLVALDDYRAPSAPPAPSQAAPLEWATIEDLPLRGEVKTLDLLCKVVAKYVPHIDPEALRRTPSLTAREAANLYLELRLQGIRVTPEAMPMIRGSTLTWLDGWSTRFSTKYPLHIFLPFIVKGRDT